ncbi:MAG: alpha-galactosidase [Acidimicrobiia bacterium]|nr:alpha-galactosidase [Acidimicrobiia bacterium]
MAGNPPSTVVVVDAGRSGLVLAVGDDGRLHQVGFGVGAAGQRPELPVALYPLAYPTFGEEVLREPALRVTHVDGVTSTRLRFESTDVSEHRHGVVHRVDLVDRAAPLAVTICYRTWPAYDVLEQWVEVTNEASGPVTVQRAAATAPAMAGTAPQLTHWGGGWAGEWTETTEALTPGTKTVASAGGVRSSLYRAPIVLFAPDGVATETDGAVAACTVAWGGDIRFDAEVALHGQVRLLAGYQSRGADRILEPGERFTSPSAYWTWSDGGVGPTSRALHRFVREQVARDGTDTRATVVNTWEAMYFDLDPRGLTAQIDRAADIGGELFLLDDGWFGTAHPRDDDTTGLGDWEVDRVKLPDGLQPIIDRTLERGLRFGLWVEPEMVNPASALYAAHPDWVVAEPGREAREERNQLVLDLCRSEVRAFVVDVIDRVLGDHPGISYLKWDANRDLTEPGSVTLAPDRQSHLAVDRVLATWEVMDAVARRHPDVELMLCASGGGRSDLGTLRRFHELWTSDNTDPVDRVRIQWGASHLLPASVLAAHVTRWGGRPFEFACAVAMSGRFGFDVDLRTLTDEEVSTGHAAAATYRQIRDLVQHGDLYRLVSPVASDRAALAYVAPGGDRAVVFAYVLPDGAPDPPIRGPAGAPIKLPWLDPGTRYEVRDVTPGPSPVDPTESAGGGGEPVELVGAELSWPDRVPPSAAVRIVTRRPS